MDGTDIRKVRLATLRDHIALVPQECLLIGDSVRGNITYGAPLASDEEVVQAAKLAMADDFIRELPQGYDTLVGERGVRLSVGQRQRIALARAFLKNASILLLDEPTSALDAETEAAIVRNIRDRLADRSILLVAHRLSTIRGSNRIVVMKHGEIVESGSHEELLESAGVYSRMWRIQSDSSRRTAVSEL